MRYEDEIVGKDTKEEKDDQPVRAKKRAVEKESTLKGSLLLLRDIGIAIAVLVLILQFYKPTIVFEHSMEDTLHPDDYVFLAKKAFVFGEIKHGDIVVFESDLLDERGGVKSLIKRVIGLPGDKIEVMDDAVYRNGKILNEPYIKDGITPGSVSVVVPPDAYFVLGDNRQVSMDSRNAAVGFVEQERIKGKVIYRLFPLSTAGVIR